MQHRQAADAGVEDPDRAAAQLLWRERLRGRGGHAASLAPAQPPPSPTPAIAAFSFLTTASAMPVSLKLPLAFTTPAIRTAISSTRPTYSTVPCPRSRPPASAACALPISS